MHSRRVRYLVSGSQLSKSAALGMRNSPPSPGLLLQDSSDTPGLCRVGAMHTRCLFAIVVAALLAVGCAGMHAIPVEGAVAEGRIRSTVDAEVARYYVEAYLPGTKERPELDRRIDELTAQHRARLPGREDLARIATDFASVDFAALFFAERLLADSCNRAVNATFARHLADTRRRDWSASRWRVLFVPGFDYVDHGHLTGADFARPRLLARQLGLDSALVEIPSVGSVRSEEHTSELQSQSNLVCRLLLEKKKIE